MSKVMKIILAALMLVSCGGAQASFTLTTSTSATCPYGSALPDGCSGAPTGTPQLPHLLDVQAVSALNVVSGSGYSNGTYTWTTSGGGGSGATGTITVSGGFLGGSDGQSYTISNYGSGYTSRPTIAIPAGAGAGSGGSITPTVYQTRPNWNVPGVDYYVGIPAGTVLRDPTTGGILPSGCSYSAGTPGTSANLVVCSGGGAHVLDSFDFCLHGGIGIYAGANVSITVTNSNFCGNFNTYGGNVIGMGFGTGSATFRNNVFNGGGTAGVTNSYASGMVAYLGTGTLDFEYNVCENINQHCLDISMASTATSGTETIKYNLAINLGTQPTAHGGLAYFCGGAFTGVTQDFNMAVDRFLPLSNTAAIVMAGDSTCPGPGTVVNSETSYNVALMQGTQSYISAPHANGQNGAEPIYINGNVDSTVIVDHNYLDYSGTYYPFYPVSAGAGVNFTSTNVNMGSGNAGCYPSTYGTGLCN